MREETKPKKTAVAVLNDLLVELFKDILTIEEHAMKNAQVFDLTIREIHTIEAIGIEGKRTMGDVAETLRVTLGTLTTSVNRLVNKGYVKRTKDKKDKRIVLVSLTSQGKKAFDIHKDFHDRMIEEIVRDLKLHEDALLISSLAKVRDYFNQEYMKKWKKDTEASDVKTPS